MAGSILEWFWEVLKERPRRGSSAFCRVVRSPVVHRGGHGGSLSDGFLVRENQSNELISSLAGASEAGWLLHS